MYTVWCTLYTVHLPQGTLTMHSIVHQQPSGLCPGSPIFLSCCCQFTDDHHTLGGTEKSCAGKYSATKVQQSILHQKFRKVYCTKSSVKSSASKVQWNVVHQTLCHVKYTKSTVMSSSPKAQWNLEQTLCTSLQGLGQKEPSFHGITKSLVL